MNTIKNLTVYLGSSGHCRDVFKQGAKSLGEEIAKRGYNLIYGGMDTGLMGILAKTAHANGADVTGIIPMKLKDSERILSGITETILVEELCDRKKRMFEMADAIITLPGGFGTVDEMLEILYWGTFKLHKKPVILINIENYWDDLISYIRGLPDFNPAYLIIAETIEQAFDKLAIWQPPEIILSNTNTRYPHFEDEISRNTAQPIIIDEATIENTYYAVCALGLRQLGKHERGIGFLNTDAQFDRFLKWVNRAAKERFITEKCLKLFSTHENEDALRAELKQQQPITINLHSEKWGD